MYLCICKGVEESHIRELASQGCRSMRAVRCKTGLGTKCGGCREHTAEFLKSINPPPKRPAIWEWFKKTIFHTFNKSDSRAELLLK